MDITYHLRFEVFTKTHTSNFSVRQKNRDQKAYRSESVVALKAVAQFIGAVICIGCVLSKTNLKNFATMRPLTDEETTQVFEKLAKFIGTNIKQMVDPSDGTMYCFRLQKDRVYYVSELVMRLATNVSRDKLASLGVCIGKFTHHKNFHLHISALNYLAKYARFKVWVKPSSEMSFLYGNHLLKAGLGRITENIEKGQGVVVYNMSDMPLGFGLAARTTADCRKAAPTDIVVLNQADLGMYLRAEETTPASAL